MEYYSGIKNNKFTKSLGKWVELENVMVSEVTQSQRNTHVMHPMISGYYPKKLGIPRKQFIYQMMPKKK